MNDTSLHIDRPTVTLRRLVEDRLRSSIASGRFRPGERLVERELCELFNVGRTSVREALRQLEAEGLIETVPHRGPVVSSLTTEEVRQLYEVRAVLESFAARKFAERRNPEDVEALGHAVKHFERVLADPSLRELIEAAGEFYEALTKGSGNIFVQEQLKVLHNRIALQRVSSMRQAQRIEASIKETRQIYSAIAAGNPGKASEASRRHVEAAARAALEIVDDHESGPESDSIEPTKTTESPVRSDKKRSKKADRT